MSTQSSLRSRNSQRIECRHSAELRLRQLESASYAEALPEGLHATHSITSEKQSLDFRRPPRTPNTYLSILFGSICGVLARKGLQELTTYKGSFLEGVVWANFVACVIMGMAVESETVWGRLLDDSSHKPLYSSKGTIPLYVGITTGFCGSCSSFSSFILEAFTKGANLPPTSEHYPDSAYGILQVIEVLLAHLGISVGGFRIGAHLTRAVEKYPYSLSPNLYRMVEIACVGLGIASYVVVVVLIATKADGAWRSWTFSCLFAPWGAFARFWLSKLLNARVRDFPMGTYVANFGGTILLGVFTLLARGRASPDSVLPVVSRVLTCHVLTGLEDGFCGCLTTVSTFVVEICGLDLFRGYIYGAVSICTSFVAMLLIVGSYNWAVGFTAPVC
ncbi:hypothetical protein JCM33374_g6658 [Metschnikowia sp. JCM 33374]|nr:hypothetical protein JCM33374_g6658 [Metschnikowia sp. JCM 33374]